MSIQVSAPGKVLILGGYLIVESPHVGLSIGVNARFVTLARIAGAPASPQPNDAKEPHSITEVRVHSPQFRQSYAFACTVELCSDDEDKDEMVTSTQMEGSSSPFIESAIVYAIAAARVCGWPVSHRIELIIRADNDFYSQRNYLEAQGKCVNTDHLRALPACMPLHGAVSKTGLGSSAAMTTSMVASLLYLLCPDSPASTGPRACDNDAAAAAHCRKAPPLIDAEMIHRVAQVAHVMAQGKVGSGFDVCTAVYGTCVYRRFPVACVEELLLSPPTVTRNKLDEEGHKDSSNNNNNNNNKAADASNVSDAASSGGCCVKKCVRVRVRRLARSIAATQTWASVTPFQLPDGLHLLLADVHRGGTNTPNMVNAVMQWHAQNTDFSSSSSSSWSLWNRLAQNNEAYLSQLELLNRMRQTQPHAYRAALQSLQHVTHMTTCASPVNDVAKEMIRAAQLADGGRRCLREMGVASGALIEPPELTRLLNDTAAMSGVFAVGCPGAGGYDAVFALVMGDDNVQAVERFWEGYAEMQVCPLLVRQDSEGIRVSYADDEDDA